MKLQKILFQNFFAEIFTEAYDKNKYEGYRQYQQHLSLSIEVRNKILSIPFIFLLINNRKSYLFAILIIGTKI